MTFDWGGYYYLFLLKHQKVRWVLVKEQEQDKFFN